ncbi:MAG: class II aldolase/adducin family protein [Desulfobulbaceae bacterium]|nr:class II aldolase/adducin family protein [Desulfobulbaceae bacterium]
MTENGLRQHLLATARAMNSQGLNQGTSGNVSVRNGEGFVITPSALPYDRCTPEDMVRVDWSGQPQGSRKPSSEWRMHRDIYCQYPQAGAVLHAHSLYCTTLACLERSIPAFHYMVAMAGGDSIRCAPYATFGTQALSDAVIQALDNRSAALLAHHGMICFAADLDQVLALAVEVETLARIYLQALQITEPSVLPDAEMAEVLLLFKGYKA